MTPLQEACREAYREGFKDAAEAACGAIVRAANHPQVLADPLGVDMSKMLEGIANTIHEHLNKMADHICQINHSKDPPSH